MLFRKTLGISAILKAQKRLVIALNRELKRRCLPSPRRAYFKIPNTAPVWKYRAGVKQMAQEVYAPTQTLDWVLSRIQIFATKQGNFQRFVRLGSELRRLPFQDVRNPHTSIVAQASQGLDMKRILAFSRLPCQLYGRTYKRELRRTSLSMI